MTIKQLLQKSNLKLSRTSSSPHLDSQLLLSFVLNKPKEYLFANPEAPVSATQAQKINSLTSQRAQGKPIAQLIKQKEFYGLNLYVNSQVLIPRPESELLVSETVKLITLFHTPITKLAIADIGTGSGAIIIAISYILTNNLPFSTANINLIATDSCKRALQVAQKNAGFYNTKIKFLHGNLLKPLKNKKINILIANLPYLPTNYNFKHKNTQGLKFEPAKALFSGKDGLDAYQEFFIQISELKHKPKHILIEFDPHQTAKLKKIIRGNLPNSKISIKKDLCGLERVIIISFSLI